MFSAPYSKYFFNAEDTAGRNAWHHVRAPTALRSRHVRIDIPQRG